MHSPAINIISQTIDKARRQALREFESLYRVKIYKKDEGSFVSDADYKVEKVIIDELQHFTPNYSILSEEAGRIIPDNHNADDYFEWVIDPIDGTTNFLLGGHYWCISIALKRVHKGKAEIVAGAITAPILGDTYWAEKGKGAYILNSNSQQLRLRVSERSNLSECCFATSMSINCLDHSKKIMDLVQKHKTSLRVCGATALDLALLAAGRYDLTFSHNTKEWDIAAGILIAQEAGAALRDYDNGQDYLAKLNLIASNRKLINL